jgi:Ca2+-binding RTX toxin-like protein
MPAPTALEQLYLELLNSARLDPQGDALRYITSYSPLVSSDADIQSALNFFGVVGTTLESAFAALAATQPLAWNDNLGAAADDHSALMVSEDTQSHQLPGEAALGARVTAAGYTRSRLAENIYAFADSTLYGHAGFMVDWGPGIDGMQNPPGHRTNIMNPLLREVGVGVIEELDPLTSVGPQIVTQDFGTRLNGPAVILLGVVYADGDANDFYSVGEGVSGVSVTSGAASTATGAAGGYALDLAAGAHSIVFSGGPLASAVTVAATLASGTNAKFDIVDGATLKLSVSASISGPITLVQALGVNGLSLTTGAGAQTIEGAKGDDTLDGGASDDTLIGGAGDDTLSGGADGDVLGGEEGDDVLNGGSGIDTATYAAAAGAVVVSLAAAGAQNTVSAGSDTLTAIENLTGSAFNDTLTGDAAANLIDGGAGRDAMAGGGGDDTFMVDDGLDTVSENPGEGTDHVIASLRWTLASNIENLTLTGAGNVFGNGNNLANAIAGNAGTNILDGKGGDDTLIGGAGFDTLIGAAGADTMIGGTGNDKYVIDSLADVLIEALGEGIDTVRASVSLTLGDNLDYLTLLGAAALDGTGNGLVNVMVGNSAANALTGLGGNDNLAGLGGADILAGGAGRDRLNGGTGADAFVFDTTPVNVANTDFINDFTVADDTIWLDDAVYAALGGPRRFGGRRAADHHQRLKRARCR